MNEQRVYSPTEVRAESQDGAMVISGYAASYNVLSLPLPNSAGTFLERIKPGAFDRSVREKADVRCLWNHKPDVVLGRTTAGTLVLSPDARGLFYRCILPNNTNGRDAYESIKRGDVSNCSFGFTVPKGGEVFEKRDAETGFPIRDLLDVNLLDVSPVAYAAYPDTSVSARERQLAAINMTPAEECRLLYPEKYKEVMEMLHRIDVLSEQANQRDAARRRAILSQIL
jgi:HK97 family phage prohead protease